MPFARKDYEAWALLGEGGEAKVYRARQKSVGRVVAIREIKPDAAVRAAHEAELLASLRHQGLAGLIDYGFDRGRFHLVQDYIQGAMPLEFGPLPALAAVRCMRHLARTLAFLHNRDVVHGDLSPGNLLLTGAEDCVLVDFGMVRRLGESSVTAMGSPRYFSPEHFLGQPFTPATDVFACGSLLYFLGSGKHLFPQKDFPSLTDAILALQDLDARKALALHWSSLPVALWPVLEGCLQFDPENRFADMDELDEVLEIAEKALRQTSNAEELNHTTDAIRKVALSKECQALETAYALAVQAKDWRGAELLVDDLLSITPGDEKIHSRLRFLVNRRKRRARGILLLGIAMALLCIAGAAFLVMMGRSSEESMQHLGQKILELERRAPKEEPLEKAPSSPSLRLVSLDGKVDYTRIWIDSLPTDVSDGFLRLQPGLHQFQGEVRGDSRLRKALLRVPAQGEVKWEWSEP